MNWLEYEYFKNGGVRIEDLYNVIIVLLWWMLSQYTTTAPPRNISLTAPTSTTLLLHWEPPEEDPRDGTILQYSIVCRFGDSDSLPLSNSSASSQSLQLTDLRPFTNYNCCVSVQRTNGNSPESCSSETTPEDGKENHFGSIDAICQWLPKCEFIVTTFLYL